jgi:Cytochrome c554 and c-prime
LRANRLPAAIALLCIASAMAGAQTPNNMYKCGACHSQQARTQPTTSMAHALSLPGANQILSAHPDLTFRRGEYLYRIQTKDRESTYTVTNGTEAISAPIKWAFGAGSQTYVLEHDGKLYESLVSYYPAIINALDITMGDQIIQPKTLIEAFGRELLPRESTACFGCHASGGVLKYRLNLDSMKPGVTCEHCHAGALIHQEAISRGKLDSVPPKLKRLSAEEISNFCGQCHRTFETVVGDLRLRGPVTVRFQPYRLAMSKCFDGSDSRISCIACHDPHKEVVRDRAWYDSKCLKCHTSGGGTASASASNSEVHSTNSPDAKPCPIAISGCASCHMPQTNLQGSHMTFTDHYIRIVRPNDAYPN